MYTQTGYERAKEIYKNWKKILSFKQQLLFKKYMLTLKKYDSQRELLTDTEINNTEIDNLIIWIIVGNIAHKIIFCKNILDINKSKFSEAKTLVDLEIARINNIIEKMQNGWCKSGHSDEEIIAILSKNNTDQSIIDSVIDYNHTLQNNNIIDFNTIKKTNRNNENIQQNSKPSSYPQKTKILNIAKYKRK